MNFIKKNLNLLLLGLSGFLTLFNFVLMTGNACVYKYNGNKAFYGSIYEFMEEKAAPVFALIFLLIGFFAIIALLVFLFLKKDLSCDKWIALGAALSLLIAAIIFFSLKNVTYNYLNEVLFAGEKKYYHLSGAAFFAGLFSLISAGAVGFYGINKISKIIK